MRPGLDYAETKPRRCFLKKIMALMVGALSVSIPATAGLMVLCDPLRRRRRETQGLVRITTLEGLPEDGTPQKYTVIAASTDAWNKYPLAPIGAVYLRRLGPMAVQAFNVICPHAGCFVEYVPEHKGFHCPCHGSTFAVNGQIKDPRSPSPRGLDSLEIEIRNGTEVWVRFQNFITGQTEKTPVT